MMDSTRSNDGFVKEPEVKLQVIYLIWNVAKSETLQMLWLSILISFFLVYSILIG